MTKKNKDFEVKISWQLLEKIANYYEFPCAVFLGNKKMFKKNQTRLNHYKNKLAQIRRILDDEGGDNVMTKSEIDRRYYKRHKREALKRVKKYYQTNKNRISEYKQVWYKRRKEILKKGKGGE